MGLDTKCFTGSQCDGCARGLPLMDGHHYDGGPLVPCTAGRGPDFNIEENLHADTTAERYDSQHEDAAPTPTQEVEAVNWTTDGCLKHHGQSWHMTVEAFQASIAKRCPLCESPPPMKPIVGWRARAFAAERRVAELDAALGEALEGWERWVKARGYLSADLDRIAELRKLREGK